MENMRIYEVGRDAGTAEMLLSLLSVKATGGKDEDDDNNNNNNNNMSLVKYSKHNKQFYSFSKYTRSQNATECVWNLCALQLYRPFYLRATFL
jgi:hypothetical protein